MPWPQTAPGITRLCCGVHAPGFDREYGSAYLPHERTCRYWRPTKDWRAA